KSRVCSLALDAPPTGTKLGDAQIHATRGKPLRSQELHRVEGHHAVGASAVGDDLSVRRELREARLELADRNGQRARKVTCAVLFGRPDVEHGDLTAPHPLQELLRIDGLHRTASLEVLPRDLLNFSQTRLRERTQRSKEAAYLVMGEAVLDVGAPSFRLDESGCPEHLQVLGGVCDGEGGLLGERLDGAGALAE